MKYFIITSQSGNIQSMCVSESRTLAEALQRFDEGKKTEWQPNKRVILSIIKINKKAYEYLSMAKAVADEKDRLKEEVL